jgi:hypothetical protein
MDAEAESDRLRVGFGVPEPLKLRVEAKEDEGVSDKLIVLEKLREDVEDGEPE